MWCPESLREAEVRLLATSAAPRVLEVGLRRRAVRTLAGQPGRVGGGASTCPPGCCGTPRAGAAAAACAVPLVQADVLALPFRDGSFDIAFSAFGAIPFVADSAAAMREVARVLRPGGRWVFAATHPMRWIFLDDPGEAGLVAIQSYFDRRPYVEVDEHGGAAPTWSTTAPWATGSGSWSRPVSSCWT